MSNEHVHPIFKKIIDSFEKHHFCAPEEDKSSRWCEVCGGYLTDEAHIRATETEKKQPIEQLNKP